jgi:hypothetical protein
MQYFGECKKESSQLKESQVPYLSESDALQLGTHDDSHGGRQQRDVSIANGNEIMI